MSEILAFIGKTTIISVISNNKRGDTMSLVVASAAKEVIKKAEMNCGGDFVDALDKKVEALINDAVARSKSNDRKTVRAGDL